MTDIISVFLDFCLIFFQVTLPISAFAGWWYASQQGGK